MSTSRVEGWRLLRYYLSIASNILITADNGEACTRPFGAQLEGDHPNKVNAQICPMPSFFSRLHVRDRVPSSCPPLSSQVCVTRTTNFTALPRCVKCESSSSKGPPGSRQLSLDYRCCSASPSSDTDQRRCECMRLCLTPRRT